MFVVLCLYASVLPR